MQHLAGLKEEIRPLTYSLIGNRTELMSMEDRSEVRGYSAGVVE
jgi:hypothetical protein